MSEKKLIVSKNFAYKYDHKDNTRLSYYISYYGDSMFKDIDWRLYDDNTIHKVGINIKKYRKFDRKKFINQQKNKITG